MLEFILDPNNLFVWILIISIIIGAIAVVSRPFLSFIQFVYPNAKYEAMGNPYIHLASLEKLMDAENLSQFVEYINADKDYQINDAPVSDIQTQFDDHLKHQTDQMSKEQGKKMQTFFTIYTEQKHSDILKQVLRANHQKIPIDTEHLIKQCSSSQIIQFIKDMADATEETVPELISAFGFDPILSNLLQSEETIPLHIDVMVDRYYLSQMKSIKLPYKCKDAIHEYLTRLTDIISIQHLLRAKHLQYHEKLCQLMFIDEGNEILSWKFSELCKLETIKDIIDSLEGTSYYQPLKKVIDSTDISKSVQPLITALDQHMLSILRSISQHYYVSIGPTLRYLISKEAEITNLKIISKGINEHLSSESIKPLLITEVAS